MASGAYIGSDFGSSSTDSVFANDILEMLPRTDHAAITGNLVVVDELLAPFGTPLSYYAKPGPERYQVESPDAIEPVNENGKTILRYAENNLSAGIAVSGSHRKILLGVPFEVIKSRSDRYLMMKSILQFLLTTPPE